MKTFLHKILKLYPALIPLLLLLATGNAEAQMPDCLSGTYMYGVFSPVTPTVNNDSLEIRPIQYSNGAVGSLMGGRRYYIVRTIGATNFYGASALGVSPFTGQFYIMTQMGTGSTTSGNKDIVMIDPLAPTATGTVIATTPINPVSLKDYHFVKLAISPNGYGYAIGVHRSSGATASTFNPLIRFTLCGTANCSTIELLGYLQSGGISDRNNLFNGDIAFDLTGNLYFLASATGTVGGFSKYTDSRLFRINVADIPAVPGTGSVPLSLVADYNSLDSTGCSGIALDAVGNMYFSLRRYTDQNKSTGPYVTELHMSTDMTTTSQISTFGPMPANTSVGDLASCYFPNGVLAKNKIQLNTRKSGKETIIRWDANVTPQTRYFEVQRSYDESNFETIAKVSPGQGHYQYIDEHSKGNRTYRIKQVMETGINFYSNASRIIITEVAILESIHPNPFTNRLDVTLHFNSSRFVTIRLIDPLGKVVHKEIIKGRAGSNKFSLTGITAISKGMYIVEIESDEEVLRHKLIRQ